MKSSTLTKLLFLLIILVGLWYLQDWRQKSKSDQLSGWGAITTEEVNADQVNKIVIDKNEQTLQLTKPETDWLVDGTAADITKVNQLLEILQNPQAEIISQNQDRYVDLGITDDQAHRLSFWQGDTEKLVILISTKNTDIIRKKNHQNVYRLSEPLNLNTNITTWLAPPTPTPAPQEQSGNSEIPEPQQ